jgi:hypothetical protein
MHYEVQSCRHYGKCVGGYRPTRKSLGIVYGRSKKKSLIGSMNRLLAFLPGAKWQVPGKRVSFRLTVSHTTCTGKERPNRARAQ